MTLEPAYEEAELLVTEATALGGLSPEAAAWVDAFYRNVETRMLNFYDAARLGAWRIYEREKVAAYWKEQLDWFNGQLLLTQQLARNLSRIRIPAQPAIEQTIQTLTDIVEACRGAYELHA
jgi:hypothetical protein